ncbi:MAG: stage II sporulation protein R [Bacilli bacterium]|nr:stage II sporulation protein R [Bacilli bacterium]MDD4733274.1 stage II sporulation protein R [Bacilli bacterium]
MRKTIMLIALIFVFYLIISDFFVEEVIIPEDSIRIRILANSNKDEDLAVKEEVKDDVQKELNKILKDSKNIKDARKTIITSMPEINNTVEKSLMSQNVYQKFDINYGYNYFPDKEYKGVIYNEGYYESVLVTLGEGMGNNWWCVLFPPLCLIEGQVNEEVEYKLFVKEMINKYF